MRLTVDVNFIDDAVQWKETDHPRKKGGEFTKKGTGEPSGKTAHWGREHKGVPLGNEYAAHVKIHKIATASGMTVEQKATAIKNYIATIKGPLDAKYANIVLRSLEKQHGLKDGSLGIAVNKGKEAPPQPKKEEAPPQPKKEEDSTNSEDEEDDDSDIYLDEDEDEEEDKEDDDSDIYLDEDEEGAKKPVVMPSPHPESGPQKQIYAIAMDPALTPQEKAAQINFHALKQPIGGFTAKYAEEVKKALGIESLLQAPQLPTMSVTSPRMKRFAERFDAAYHPNGSASEATLKKRIPTASRSTWETFPAVQRASIEAYTGHSYSYINRALRDPEEADAAVMDMVTAIDDAFESEHARIMEDMILYRGFKLPDEVITKLTKAVGKGLPTRFDQQGFVSTSLKSQTAHGFSSNVVMQILARKGTPALYLKPVSSHKAEEEVLLRHGQSFEVVSIAKDPNTGKFLMKVVAN